MLVSICIPNYNNAKYLDMCIKSALNQTYDDIEIILVDDKSTDNSLSIAKKYKDKIKIFTNKKNLGQPNNTNRCIELSKGEYLVILHSDDCLLPDMVKKLVPLLKDNPNVGMAVGERIIINENNKETKITPFYNTDCIVPGIKQARIFMMTSFLPCQVLVRREVIDKFGGVDERHISNLDGLLWFKCCVVSDMAYIQDEVCCYRVHSEQQTAIYNRTINHMMEYYITLSKMFKIAKGNKYLEDFFPVATKRTGELCLRYCNDALKEKDYELVKRYLILATVFDGDIINTEKYKTISKCVLNKTYMKNSVRDFSYSPPKGSITMEIQNLLNWLRTKKVIIYGAGKVGKSIERSLLHFGIKSQFWDDTIVGYEPYKLLEEDDYVIIMAIYSEEICRKIAFDLCYKNIITRRELINSLISQACSKFDLISCHMCPIPKNECDIFVETFTKKKELIIPTLGILVSNRCNLSCEGCNHLRYLYSAKDNIESTSEEIIEDLKKIIDVSDLICKVVVVGGEAFLHPKIFEILKEIKGLLKIGFIHIITNGTVIPSDNVFRIMSDDKIILEISNYKLSKKLQNNKKKFIKKLEKYNVNYLIMDNLQWYDFGNFNKRSHTKHPYKECCFISNEIFNGKMHKCSRSTFATHLGLIPDYSKDYIDIRKATDLKESLIKFLRNQTPKVCLHCNGTTIKMRSGEQN